MSKQTVAFVAIALCIQACPKDIDRITPITTNTNLNQLVASKEFAQLRCDDASGNLSKARNEALPEGERLKTYVDLYLSLQDRKKRLDEAIARNSDLAYQEGAQAILHQQETCSRYVTEVRLETERFIRDLVDMPTFQEIQGGNAVIVPRVDLKVLRLAIQSLDMDGTQELLQRVDNAEQKLGPVKAPPRGR